MNEVLKRNNVFGVSGLGAREQRKNEGDGTGYNGVLSLIQLACERLLICYL